MSKPETTKSNLAASKDKERAKTEELASKSNLQRIKEARESGNVASLVGSEEDPRKPYSIDGEKGSLLFIGQPFVKWDEDQSGEYPLGDGSVVKISLVGFDTETVCGVYEWEVSK